MTQLTISELMKANRKRRGWAQAKAAAAAGIHRSQWAAYELGAKVPEAPHVLAALAEILELDVSKVRAACDESLSIRSARREASVRRRLVAAYEDRRRKQP